MLSWCNIPVTVSNYGNIEIWTTTFGWQWHLRTYHAATQSDKTRTCNPVRTLSPKTFSWRLLFTCQRVWSAMAYRAPRCGAVSRSFCLWSCCVLTIRANSLKGWRVRYPRYQYNTFCQICSGCSNISWYAVFRGYAPFSGGFSFLFLKIEI